MPLWLLTFAAAAGALLALKILYLAAWAAALPLTRGALYVSTARRRIDVLLEAVPMSAGQLMVDLGCGDGRVLRAAARRYPVAAVGYEVNLLAYLKARLLCAGQRSVTVRLANFWRADLAAADVVFCYLYPDVLGRLAAKLERELRPGTLVISANFPLPGWALQRVVRHPRPLYGSPFYVYRKASPAPAGRPDRRRPSGGSPSQENR